MIDMKRIPRRAAGFGLLAAFAVLGLAPVNALAQPAVEAVVSRSDLSLKLAPADPPVFARGAAPADGDSIKLDPSKTFQTILGLGSSFESTTCFNLSLLGPEERDRTIERLVHPERGIGFNLVRICIGTPDFTGDPWYSYDDLPAGESDPALEKFSIERDKAYILPALAIARAKNPDLLFFASPWSPPGWMKSTGDMIGGHLLPERYDVYARYFVKFIRAYEAEGIPIHAITVQNEPGVDRSKESNPKWHYPSCKWRGEEERDFIKNHLGPLFEREGIKTEIWCYDHNYNAKPTLGGDDPGIGYPRAILSDPGAAKFVDAVAFHGYAGQPSGMSALAGEFPGVPFHFTEGSVFGLPGAAKLATLFQHGISGYNGWVTMIDTQGKPNNGPFEADKTMILLDHEKKTTIYPFDYYMLGQFTKFIARGAKRIEAATDASGIKAVAFRNPDGEIALIVVNSNKTAKPIALSLGEWNAAWSAMPQSVSTLRIRLQKAGGE